MKNGLDLSKESKDLIDGIVSNWSSYGSLINNEIRRVSWRYKDLELPIEPVKTALYVDSSTQGSRCWGVRTEVYNGGSGYWYWFVVFKGAKIVDCYRVGGAGFGQQNLSLKTQRVRMKKALDMHGDVVFKTLKNKNPFGADLGKVLEGRWQLSFVQKNRGKKTKKTVARLDNHSPAVGLILTISADLTCQIKGSMPSEAFEYSGEDSGIIELQNDSLLGEVFILKGINLLKESGSVHVYNVTGSDDELNIHFGDWTLAFTKMRESKECLDFENAEIVGYFQK